MTLAERIQSGSAPEFFQAPAGPEFLHPSLHETFIGPEGFAQLQARRMHERARRIAAQCKAKGAPITHSTRGAAREVVCLTKIDPANPRRLLRFRTVSLAAIDVGQKCDNICQAIRRKGTCGGHRYQYSAKLPRNFNEAAVVRRLRVLSRQRGGRILRLQPRVAVRVAC